MTVRKLCLLFGLVLIALGAYVGVWARQEGMNLHEVVAFALHRERPALAAEVRPRDPDTLYWLAYSYALDADRTGDQGLLRKAVQDIVPTWR